jgi:tetratricopeptide (TPR) repeat protein
MHLGGRRIRHIRVERFLGQGGMGDVYEGFDEKLRRRVALKVLHRHPGDSDARARLIREAHALSQLEHPNICRIHDLIDDEPDVDVLVLELIEGRTLTEVLRDKLPRTEQLRIAVSIAEVLVTAHRANIIHRDLKPDNIMLTKDGVVKVLDFGLARWIERTTGSHIAIKTPQPGGVGFVDAQTTQPTLWRRPELNDGSPIATAVGIAVGTPLYMSPEQARGATLTSASDMYSFGLVLQTLITGDEPYPSMASGAEVMLKAAMGESLPAKSNDREFVALIQQLKQLAPSDRPTAIDALAKLRYMVEKPKRLARYAAIVAAIFLVAFGVTKYTLDLTRAEGEARRRRAQADDLISFMVGDLRRKLEPVGRLDVLDAAATKALDYASSLDPKELDEAELLRTSSAFNQLGEVRIGQGRLADAMTAFRHSLTLAEEAARRKPNDGAAQLAVGTSHFWIGNAYRLKGSLGDALTHMRQYMTAAQALASREPKSEKYQLERAYGHSTVATILEAQGELRGALEQYRVALDAKQALVTAAPNDNDRQFDLTITLNHIGFVLQRLGRLREARDYFERESEMLRTLVARDAKQTQWQTRLAISHGYLGALLEELGDDEASLPERNAEVSIEKALNELDPANADWKRNLAITRMRLGELRRRNGDVQGASQSIGDAEQSLRQLIAIDPSRSSWQRDLGIVRIARARALLAEGDTRGAGAAIDDAERLLAPSANDPASLRFIADVQLVRGDVLAAGGSTEAARAAWTKGRQTIEPAARTSADPHLMDMLARLLQRLNDPAAEPLVERLAAIGYRPRDLTNSGRDSRVRAAERE